MRHVNFRADEETVLLLDKIASLHDTSRSEYLRLIVTISLLDDRVKFILRKVDPYLSDDMKDKQSLFKKIRYNINNLVVDDEILSSEEFARVHLYCTILSNYFEKDPKAFEPIQFEKVIRRALANYAYPYPWHNQS